MTSAEVADFSALINPEDAVSKGEGKDDENDAGYG